MKTTVSTLQVISPSHSANSIEGGGGCSSRVSYSHIPLLRLVSISNSAIITYSYICIAEFSYGVSISHLSSYMTLCNTALASAPHLTARLHRRRFDHFCCLNAWNTPLSISPIASNEAVLCGVGSSGAINSPAFPSPL
jgi:hypothetical protein